MRSITGLKASSRSRLRRLAGLGTALSIVASGLLPATSAHAGPSVAAVGGTAATAALPSIGMNLDGVTDWSTAWPFVDAFRASRSWISQLAGAPWGQGPPLSLDERGWVRSLQPGQTAETPILDESLHMPRGRYVVTWEGDGDVSLWGGDDPKILNRTANRFEFDLGKTGIFLRLTRINPAAPVRNIHVWMPGYEQTGAQQIFHPMFLDRLKGVSTLRFMDWMLTNDPNRIDVASLSTYPRPDSATQTNGVAPELMTALANRVGADPWFTMPQRATDDFVRAFATVVRDTTAANRKIYIEYSNENWNSAFPTAKYVQDAGLRLGLSTNRFEAGLRYQAQRSVEIFRIWREVFGAEADSRLVRVLAAQSVNSWTGETLLSWQDAYREADAIAIAPYFRCTGAYLPGDRALYAPGAPNVARYVKPLGVARLLDNCQREINTDIRAQITSYRLVAERYGVALVGYEGGQHLVGYLGAENDADLAKLFQAANRDPRMRAVYASYLDTWQRYGGGMLAAFSFTGAWSKWGSWGMLEYQDQPIAAAPKYQATMDFARALRTGAAREIVPIVTALSTRTGTRAGGTEVTIQGSRLATATAVTFGGTAARFRRVDVDGVATLVATAPAHLPGTAEVTVTNRAGSSGATAQTSFTYTALPPTITRLSVTRVPSRGGTLVTLTGTNLTGAYAVVTAGTAYATSVRVVSDSQVQFVTSAWRPGDFDVVVRNPAGPSPATNAGRLTYF